MGRAGCPGHRASGHAQGPEGHSHGGRGRLSETEEGLRELEVPLFLELPTGKVKVSAIWLKGAEPAFQMGSPEKRNIPWGLRWKNRKGRLF